MKLLPTNKSFNQWSFIAITRKIKKQYLIIAFSSFLLLSAIPFFLGSGLSAAKEMDPYLNNNFPNRLFPPDALYRPAFPNLTFWFPITFDMVPNEETLPINQQRIVVAELGGVIKWFINDENTSTANTILDLSSQVAIVSDGGFLGLAFHPDFGLSTNPKNYMYVYYSSKDRNGQNNPTGYDSQDCFDEEEWGNFLILERYSVDPSTLVADPNSRQKLIVRKMFGETHRGGGLEFGDDGFLYLTTGDQATFYKAQDIISNMDGGVLRLDVDMQGGSISHPPIRKLQDHPRTGVAWSYSSTWYTNNAGPHPSDGNGGVYDKEYSGVNYYIPNDNPFCDNTPGSSTNLYGQPNLETTDPNDVYQPGDFYEEYYAVGLRNPHRMNKDIMTGVFYIGEVGLNTHEEIDVLSPNANFSWPIREGNIPGPGCRDMFNNMPHTAPLVSFLPTEANSIIGGYVYRGNDIPELDGKYICADYGDGDEIWFVDPQTGYYEQLGTFLPTNIISFGQDYEGEVFILSAGNFTAPTNLYKLTAADAEYYNMPQKLSETGVFKTSTNTNAPFENEFADLLINDGVVPYELIESFWSDGALKRRWLAIPNNDGVHAGANEQIDYSEYGDWDFPEGSVLIKHFDLNIDKNDPNALKKIETRFSVKGNDGNFYYLTYKWREDQTDADLLQTAEDRIVQITTENSQTVNQTWHYPSFSECVTCHNQASKGGLGLKTRYLNSDYTYDDNGTLKTANQLVTLSHLGIINTVITDTDTPNLLTHKALSDASSSVEERARSYMDLNCAYCHRPETDNRAQFDLRLFNDLETTGLLTAGVVSSLGIAPDEKILFAGDASKSILFHRMNSIDPAIMMPPLAKGIIHEEAVQLVEEWINQLDVTNLTNTPSPVVNLALLPSAQLSGSVDEESGRGTPLSILYDPLIDDYRLTTQFGEYGVAFNQNLGTPDAENGFFWRVDWDSPKFVNYITFGGAYSNQRQQNTMWRVSYLRNGAWYTIEEGQGGWIDNATGDDYTNISIYEWGGANQSPVYAEAIRLQLFSDGVNDLVSIHLRARGGYTYQYEFLDSETEPKATLIQFLPFNNPTTIDNIVAGNQGSCNPLDNTYTQELTIFHTNAPETGTLVVNGQEFAIEESPQTITLVGLEANGLGVEVNALFTDGYNTAYKSNGELFTAQVNCSNNIIIGVDESMVINQDYTLGNDSSIQILEGGSLTVNGNLTIIGNGYLELNSTSTKYSSLIVNGTSTGTIVYKRHINAFSNNNDLISAPVKNLNFSNFESTNPNIYSNPVNTEQKLFGHFDEPDGEYKTYSTTIGSPDLALDLGGGIGFRAARDNTMDGSYGTTFTFNGEIETDNVITLITDDGTGAFKGWNLIGNPFSSYINFGDFFDTNKLEFGDGAFQAVYGYDGDASNGWKILNNLNASEKIAPGQAFFVSSKIGGGSVSFLKGMRVSGNSDDFIQGRATMAHLGNLKLQINNTVNTYVTDFYFNTNASLGLDPGYDAAMFGGSAPAFALYSHLVQDNSGLPMAIQALGQEDMSNVRVPLGVHVSQGMPVTVSIAYINLPANINVYLEDTANNTYTRLNDGNYSFTADANLTGTGRFFLRFEDSALSVVNNTLNDLLIYNNSNTKELIISGQLETPCELDLYDLKGSLLGRFNLDRNNAINKVKVDHLSQGVYIAKLTTSLNRVRIVKLIVK